MVAILVNLAFLLLFVYLPTLQGSFFDLPDASPEAVDASVKNFMSSSSTPLPAPKKANEWSWVSINGSKCMDGAETGIYVKASAKGWSNAKLAVYFEGGGACFNLFTCSMARNEPHPSPPGTTGEFSSSDSRNPYLDFNWIWVPYCSGDVHSGNAFWKDFDFHERYFNGHNNVGLIMSRAVATWPALEVLAVTGESAGGFGAAINYDFIRRFWGTKAKMGVMVDDSGPILDNEAMAVCLQEQWRNDWALNKTLPPDCPCVSDAGNMWLGWKFFVDRWPNDTVGLISSVRDVVISSFFSFGNLDCESPIPTYYDKLSGGLDRLASNNRYNVSIFMIPGGVHTHTGAKPSFYTLKSGDTLLYKWIAQIVSGINPGTVWVK